MSTHKSKVDHLFTTFKIKLEDLKFYHLAAGSYILHTVPTFISLTFVSFSDFAAATVTFIITSCFFAGRYIRRRLCRYGVGDKTSSVDLEYEVKIMAKQNILTWSMRTKADRQKKRQRANNFIVSGRGERERREKQRENESEVKWSDFQLIFILN